MSGHPRTHQNAILRTYAGLLLISICVYTLMYAPQPMFSKRRLTIKSTSARKIFTSWIGRSNIVFLGMYISTPSCANMVLKAVTASFDVSASLP